MPNAKSRSFSSFFLTSTCICVAVSCVCVVSVSVSGVRCPVSQFVSHFTPVYHFTIPRAVVGNCLITPLCGGGDSPRINIGCEMALTVLKPGGNHSKMVVKWL